MYFILIIFGLKNKNAQTIKDTFGYFLISSQRKPNKIETNRGKAF